jgi:hypothetical protein
MPEFFRTFFSWNPGDIRLVCPAAAPGQSANPYGFFDPGSVAAAFRAATIASITVALLAVLVCYLATSTSLGPQFVRRWWIFGAATAVLAAVITAVTLLAWPTHAMAGTCETNPFPFALDLPMNVALLRGIGGLFWGFLAFVLFSLLLTRTAGYAPMAANGFFHNRGCPAPRWR